MVVCLQSMGLYMKITPTNSSMHAGSGKPMSCQVQTKRNPNRWWKSGMVKESLKHNEFVYDSIWTKTKFFLMCIVWAISKNHTCVLIYCCTLMKFNFHVVLISGVRKLRSFIACYFTISMLKSPNISLHGIWRIWYFITINCIQNKSKDRACKF